MASRKDNFYAYYRANPDKLKGRTIDEAYAAMRRQVNRTSNRTAKSDAGSTYKRAIERKVGARTGGTTNSPAPAPWRSTNSLTPRRPAYKPLTVSDATRPIGREIRKEWNEGKKEIAGIGRGIKDLYNKSPKVQREKRLEEEKKARLERALARRTDRS